MRNECEHYQGCRRSLIAPHGNNDYSTTDFVDQRISVDVLRRLNSDAMYVSGLT
jgi:hypothetical protein